MSGATLFGVCGAALVGLGVWGLICQPGALRKILGFNLLGGGVFLIFGAIARRGGGRLSALGEGVDGDPVPQALVITGLVVAFAATAIAVALLLRLAEVSGRSGFEGAGPGSAEAPDPGDGQVP